MKLQMKGKSKLFYHASLDPCWHIYSQFLGSDDGPIATAFYNNANEIVEGVTECTPLIAYDPNFMMDLKYFDEEVYWSSIISLSDLESADTLKGSLLYMVCDETMCLPPTDVYYKLPLSELNPADSRPELCPPSKHLCHGEESDKGLFWIFIMGFGLGLAALFNTMRIPIDTYDCKFLY